MAEELFKNKDINPQLTTSIEQARSQSFQDRATAQPLGGLSVIWWATKAGLNVSPWWSAQRDVDLRKFWKQPDYLAGAVYAMESKMSAIPFNIVPIDTSNKDHVAQAEEVQQNMMAAAEYGEGWVAFYGKFIEDLLTVDNGAFAEIIGNGDPSGPIVGAPLTIAHLDSSRCIRTGNPEFPVLYKDTDGKMFKLHYTRVLFTAQMSSPIVDMYGVGFCSISRCLNVSQTLLDILTFKQEKLGSRPHRNVMITRGGLDPQDVKTAFQIADQEMTTSNLSRYSKTVVVGSSSIMEADIHNFDLASLPDGFNEEMSITMGMATIALAFGVDARELFPAMGVGATRADAILQHLKQRGKGPGQIIQATETQFNHKFLPPHLKMVFDFQDDAEDRQVAEIKQIRSNYRGVQLKFNMVNTRVAREQMMQAGDIDRGQFEELELADGRLDDGTDVTALFYSTDKNYKQYLDLGVDQPTNIAEHTPEEILPVIADKKIELKTAIINEKSFATKIYQNRALAALNALEQTYTGIQKAASDLANANAGRAPDTRVRTSDTTAPTTDNDLNTSAQASAGSNLNQATQDQNTQNKVTEPNNQRKQKTKLETLQEITEKNRQASVESTSKRRYIKTKKAAQPIYRVERDENGKILGIVEETTKEKNAFAVVRDEKGAIIGIEQVSE